MKLRIFFSLLIYIILISAIPTVALPKIDGTVNKGEWAGAELHRIELNTGIEANLSIIYTDSYVYYMAAIDHSRSVDKIILNQNSETQPHDYFGIEFDNNEDEAIMGTTVSPDDTIIVNYYTNIGADMFMESFKAYFDEEHGGQNNVQGKAGTDGKTLFFEIQKPMKSTDSKGYDFTLSEGFKYQIMVAFWDDQPAHSAAVGFNKRVDNSQFYTLVVGQPQSRLVSEIIATFLILLSLGLGFFVSKNGLTGIEKLIKGDS